MSTHTAKVEDVTDADFEHAVIARSSRVPVLVDFWAPWCGPCRMLGPVLEALASEMAGRFVLAKVNTDSNQASAARYQVRGIPHVILFKDGEPVEQFVGVRGQEEVRALLRKHCLSEADELVAQGREQLRQGDVAGARAAFEQALAGDAGCHAAHLALARLAVQEGRLDDVAAHVRRIPPLDKVREAAEYVQQAAELARGIELSEDEARARLADDAGDVEASFALGVHRMARGAYREALDCFLAVAEANRKWRDEAARKAMLVVFGLVGVRDPLADEYRRKLMFIY